MSIEKQLNSVVKDEILVKLIKWGFILSSPVTMGLYGLYKASPHILRALTSQRAVNTYKSLALNTLKFSGKAIAATAKFAAPKLWSATKFAGKQLKQASIFAKNKIQERSAKIHAYAGDDIQLSQEKEQPSAFYFADADMELGNEQQQVQPQYTTNTQSNERRALTREDIIAETSVIDYIRVTENCMIVFSQTPDGQIYQECYADATCLQILEVSEEEYLQIKENYEKVKEARELERQNNYDREIER